MALGAHCKKIRIKKGYSIDRLAKESDQLSPSVIHRLENATGAVTIVALLRYAEVLELSLRELLDFPFQEKKSPKTVKILPLDFPRAEKEAFKTFLPFYSAQAAAGYFGDAKAVEPDGWIEVGKKNLEKNMFVIQVKGHSMEPLINSGDYVAMRANPSGTKQGKIVLAQYRGPEDPDTGGSYTIKKYASAKVYEKNDTWKHQQITLTPLNNDYEPIVLYPEDKDDFRIIAEFLFVLE